MTLLDDIDRCVMCGLCLPHCPTYRLTLNEAESPRGRLELLRVALAETGTLSPAGVAHLDHCLACRSCESMCPSSVPYGRILDAGRAHLTASGQRRVPALVDLIEAGAFRPPWMARIVSAASLGQALGGERLLRHLPMRGATAIAEIAPIIAERTGAPPLASQAPSTDPGIQLFLGCLDGLINRKTLQDVIDLLDALGLTVTIPPDQVCCGAISHHEGHPERARALARRNTTAFDPAMPVVAVSTGCSAHLGEHAVPATQDILDFLTPRLHQLTFKPLPERVVVHVPCSQRNVLRQGSASARVLAAIPDVELIPLPEQPGCCGAAGTYFLRESDTAGTLRDELLDAIAARRPERLVSANLGCALHLEAGLRQRGLDIRVEHPTSLLARQLVRR